MPALLHTLVYYIASWTTDHTFLRMGSRGCVCDAQETRQTGLYRNNLYLHKPVNRWDKIPGVEEEEGEADDHHQAAQVQGCILHGVEPEAFAFQFYWYELTLKIQADRFLSSDKSHKKAWVSSVHFKINERKRQILALWHWKEQLSSTISFIFLTVAN